MNRLWIGGVLLALFLIAGIWIAAGLGRLTEPVSALLEAAQAAALRGEQTRSEELVEKAQNQWQHCRKGLAAVCYHDPIEEAESLFAQLRAYAGAELWGDFAACCARLAQQLQALAESQVPTWWNLL